MKEILNVVVTSQNREKGKTVTNTIEGFSTLHEAVRCVLTFKPKRGYTIVHYAIEMEGTLLDQKDLERVKEWNGKN